MRSTIASILTVAALAAGCGDGTGDPDGGVAPTTGVDMSTTALGSPTTVVDDAPYTFDLTPADFVTGIDNPLMPLTPGSRWVYEGEDNGEVERIEVVVTDETRQVMGITATVVRDTVTIDGELVEDTFDWFAQDTEGNVWYLGEESKEYEDGEVVSTAGSWEAGVDGALPGVIMWAHPEVGDRYRQEYYPGEAEDMAEVVKTGASESVPHGAYDDLVVIAEWNPLDPGVTEEKYYAAGVGVILEVVTAGGTGRVELVEYTPGG
jgi:hypothetical protein